MILLSHIRCFFCGKDSAVSSFDPSDLDLDLYVRQVRGLGYGGGFAAGPDESVLGDDYFTPQFFDRSIAFLKLLIEKGIVAKDELENSLKIGIQFVDSEDVLPYDDFINILKKENINLKRRISYLQHQDTVTSQNYVPKTNYNKLVKKYNNFKKEVNL